MAAIISRIHTQININVDTPEEADEWFDRLAAIVQEMYPEDYSHFQGEVDVEDEDSE